MCGNRARFAAFWKGRQTVLLAPSMVETPQWGVWRTETCSCSVIPSCAGRGARPTASDRCRAGALGRPRVPESVRAVRRRSAVAGEPPLRGGGERCRKRFWTNGWGRTLLSRKVFSDSSGLLSGTVPLAIRGLRHPGRTSLLGVAARYLGWKIGRCILSIW